MLYFIHSMQKVKEINEVLWKKKFDISNLLTNHHQREDLCYLNQVDWQFPTYPDHYHNPARHPNFVFRMFGAYELWIANAL